MVNVILALTTRELIKPFESAFQSVILVVSSMLDLVHSQTSTETLMVSATVAQTMRLPIKLFVHVFQTATSALTPKDAFNQINIEILTVIVILAPTMRELIKTSVNVFQLTQDSSTPINSLA
jgi:hypothetical protein